MLLKVLYFELSQYSFTCVVVLFVFMVGTQVFLCFCGVCFWGGILINRGSFVIVLGLEQYQSEYILGLKLYAKSSSLCLLSLTSISVCVVSYLKIQFAVNMFSIGCYISIYIFCSYDWYIHVPDVWIDISISIVDGVEYYPHICGLCFLPDCGVWFPGGGS